MIKQAIDSTPKDKYGNVEFREASAEDLSFIPDGSLDIVVAGQAAHWFDYSKVWPELSRKLRRGGTVAFWGYKDNVFVEHPKATSILDEYCYGPNTMGPFWEQPGRNILRDKYKDIVPPEEDFESVERITVRAPFILISFPRSSSPLFMFILLAKNNLTQCSTNPAHPAPNQEKESA
jgi:ubiquinone/menaquinone biosynthesis C-methylase UbiE